MAYRSRLHLPHREQRELAPPLRPRPAAAAMARAEYTLLHAGRQVRLGPVAFWICGLLLCLFVGPTLASARALMLRMSVEGKEGVSPVSCSRTERRNRS